MKQAHREDTEEMPGDEAHWWMTEAELSRIPLPLALGLVK